MQCTLCPRACRAERNESTGNGFCQLPTTMRIARIAPHLWEEPPISGKNGTGAVFFSGCTLRCAYCQNADISHRNAGRPFTPRELADSLRRLEDMGMAHHLLHHRDALCPADIGDAGYLPSACAAGVEYVGV